MIGNVWIITYRSNSLFQREVKHYIQRSLNSLTPSGIRNNYCSRERSLLLYLSIRKRDKIDCCNYWGTLLLSSLYKTLSNTPFSMLTPCVDKINKDCWRGFWNSRSNSGWIFLHLSDIGGTMGIQSDCTLYKSYSSVRREVLHIIVIELV
jgi:hypothetical protein